MPLATKGWPTFQSSRGRRTHLLGDQVKKGFALLDREQRLCLLEAHRRAEASVELEHGCCRENILDVVGLCEVLITG
jgi:hypothetical protein